MLAAFPDLDAETCLRVLSAAGEFATEVLAPLNRRGDIEGARNGAAFALDTGVAAPRRADEIEHLSGLAGESGGEQGQHGLQVAEIVAQAPLESVLSSSVGA
ncbi:MAG TPA: hypothetical protein VHW69_04290 [Rhizomicrobium sp.]|jgi:hypothetical protein|nr:hypothetical protein [Rhizomicrobium sp.]